MKHTAIYKTAVHGHLLMQNMVTSQKAYIPKLFTLYLLTPNSCAWNVVDC